MLVVTGFLLTILFGLFLSFFIVPKIHCASRLGFSYLLGVGILTIFMFVSLLAGISLTWGILLSFLLMVNFVLGAFFEKPLKWFLKEMKKLFDISGFTKWQLLLLAIIIMLNLYVLVLSLYLPIRDWDAITLYNFRAKILADPISVASYMKAQMDGYYYGYPLLTSLSYSLVYVLGGNNPLFLSALFYSCLSLIFYGALREVSSRTISLLAVLLVISHVLLVQHATTAYINLPFATYYSMGTIFLFLWMAGKKKGYLALAGVLTALSVWTRDSEPFWLADFSVLLFYAFREKKPIPPFVYLVFILPLRFVWGVFKDRAGVYVTSHQFTNILSIITGNLNYTRMGEVLEFLGRALYFQYLPIISFFFIFVLIDLRRLLGKERLCLLVLIFANLGAFFVGSYIFSFTYRDWLKIPGSIERVFMFFPPLFVYYIVLVYESFKRKTTIVK